MRGCVPQTMWHDGPVHVGCDALCNSPVIHPLYTGGSPLPPRLWRPLLRSVNRGGVASAYGRLLELTTYLTWRNGDQITANGGQIKATIRPDKNQRRGVAFIWSLLGQIKV